MNGKQQRIIVVIILTGFIFGVSFSTLYAQTHIIEGTACGCTLPVPVLIPTFSSLGVLVGSIVYYFMFPKVEKYSIDTKTLIELLEKNEKEVIQKIVENGGEITQSKLSKLFGKVKAFRIIQTLERRNIVQKEPYGKTNMIKLNEKFRKILCS